MTGASKRDLRRALRANRAGRSRADVEQAGADLAGHAEALVGETIALYAGIDSEPPTIALLAALLRRGTRILLPVLRSDMDLEWAPVGGVGELTTSPYGLLEPSRRSLGTEGIREADLVLAPGLAVDLSGVRLGQGGGCYDRALARVSVSIYVVLFDGEIVEWLPSEAHDHPVDGTLTPSGGLERIQAGGRGWSPESDRSLGSDPTPGPPE